MKISIVLGPFQPPPPAGLGAVEKVWWAVAGELAAAGHEVHITAKKPPADACGPRGAHVRYVRGSTATGRLWLDLVKDLGYALRVAIALPRAEVVVTNSFWLPLVLGPFERWKGRIVVHAARFPKGQMRLYRRATVIHTVSHAVARAIAAECAALRPRIVVIGNPVDVDVYRPRPGTAGDARGLEVLYVGRLHPEKGLELLVNAFRDVARRCPGASLCLVGSAQASAGGGGGAFLSRLRAGAQGLPVRFEEAIHDESRLAQRYRDAAVFCYPSAADRGESFGRAVLEAMACGMPCVVSSLECFDDFFVSGEHGLAFDHRAPHAERMLADALVCLLSDRARAAAMGLRARQRALDYSLPAVSTAYREMLERAAASMP